MNFIKSYKKVINYKYLSVYLIYFAFFIVNGPFEKIIPLLLEYKGFNESSYGIFLSIINVIHIFLPAFVAYLTRKINPYKIAVFAMVLSLLGGFFTGATSKNSVIIFMFLIIIVLGRTIFNFSFGNSINYSLPEENRGKFFALRDLFLFGAISIGLFLGSVYISKFNIGSFYTIFSFMFIVPCILIFRGYKKTSFMKEENEEEHCKDKLNRNSINTILKDRRFWIFLIVEIATTTYATTLNFVPLLGTSLGISTSNIMTMFGAITIINSICALIIGSLSDEFGRKWVYVFDLAFDILPAAIFMVTNSVTLFIIGIVLTMIKDIFAPISFAYFFDCFEDSNGVLILGLLSSVANALSFIIPLAIGVLWSASYKYVFFIAIAGNLIAAVIAALGLPNKKSSCEG